jgi:hypothetical protein
MEQSCYAIEQHQSHWVVLVCGTMVLSCKTKRTALKTARRAMVLLHQSQQVENLRQGASCIDADVSFRHGGTVLRRERPERYGAPATMVGTRRG